MSAPAQLELIPLAEAVLCANCNVVSRAKNGHCPACAGSGESLVNLSTVLNRAPGAQKEGQ